MASIKVKDLTGHSICEVDAASFIQNLSEDELNLQGGQCDVIIRIGRIVIPCPINPKPMPILF
jgi:hypothetical protein